MKIVLPEDFFSILKNHHLLLDTNVFIDTSINTQEFEQFFNQLRLNNITIVTIDAVIIEFLKGAADKQKLDAKLALVNEIIESRLPTTDGIFKNVQMLLNLYKAEGKGVSVVDLLLGGILVQYPQNLFLLTKNTTDFPTNIFNLATYLNLLHRKAIQSYGVYNYLKI